MDEKLQDQAFPPQGLGESGAFTPYRQSENDCSQDADVAMPGARQHTLQLLNKLASIT